MKRPLRVQFAHGLEGSPKGRKATYLAAHFETLTPAMDTADFEACVTLHAEVLETFRPEVLVGSSFGGAVAVALLQRGTWRGPTLLLAPAVRHLGLSLVLVEGVRVRIAHGTEDEVVLLSDSRELAKTGSAGMVDLIEVDDGHALDSLVTGDRLAEWVRELGVRVSGRRLA